MNLDPDETHQIGGIFCCSHLFGRRGLTLGQPCARSSSNSSAFGFLRVLSLPSGPVGAASVPRAVLPTASLASPRASALESGLTPYRASPSRGSRWSSLSRYFERLSPARPSLPSRSSDRIVAPSIWGIWVAANVPEEVRYS